MFSTGSRGEVYMQEFDRLQVVAATYNQADFEGLMSHASADRIAALGRGTRCLEVGAAAGITTEYLSRRFESVVVIEPAARYAALVRSRALPNVTVVECLFEDFPTDTTFDTIVLAHLLEHVSDPQGILQAATRLLQHDGVILIVVPNAGSLHRHVGVLLGMLGSATDLTPADHSIGHRRVYDVSSLRSEIEGAGLKVEELTGNFCKPLSNAQMGQLPVETQAAFLKLGDHLPAGLASELVAVCRR
jgi:2-polyprenyl-3-methyl-5-hydroxy-6-metoxy-1,4-benzoquinol methylase